MVESNYFDWLWKLIGSFVPSIERHPGTAAWVQAVFSVVAIAAAVWVAQWQTQRNIRHERRIREEDAEVARCRAENEAEESRRRLAGALCAELNGLIARFLSLGIMTCYKQNSAILKNSNINSTVILKYFSASQNYTVFYNNSSASLHLLDEDIARDLVRVYIDIKGCLDTVNLYSAKHFWCIDAGDHGRRKDLAQQYRAIAAYIDDTLKEADGLANKLDYISRGEPVDDDD